MADFVFTPDMLNPGAYIRDAYGFFVSGVPDFYCATLKGATALQQHLKDNGISTTIVMDWPQRNWNTSYFSPSSKVPWLDDGKGAVENAGQLLDNYRVLPYSLADRTVLGSFALDDTQAGQ